MEIVPRYYAKLNVNYRWMNKPRYVTFCGKEAALEFIQKQRDGGVKYDFVEGYVLKDGERTFKLKEVVAKDHEPKQTQRFLEVFDGHEDASGEHDYCVRCGDGVYDADKHECWL